MPDDGLEQRDRIAASHVGLEAGIAFQGRGIDDGEVELLVRSAEPIEEVEGLVQHPVGPGAVTVDLVDDDERREAARKCLLGNKAGLRHWPVDGIDEQQHTVDHRQDALDFAAEVGVSRRVDDIDPPVLPGDGRVLGEDRDPALALEVVGVHDPVRNARPLVESTGLLQQPVDERGLAMIDMRDDGNVANSVGWEHLRARGKRARIIGPNRSRNQLLVKSTTVSWSVTISMSAPGVNSMASSAAGSSKPPWHVKATV